MIHRIFPQKDTFITNVQKSRVQQTGSNFGAAESLDLFKIAGVSGTIGVAGTSSLSRILMKFDLSTVSALTASGMAPTSGIQYFLKLRHVTTAETLPASFDVTVHRLSADWDEGRGLDVESYLDKGYANWVKPKSNSTWASGSDYSDAVTSSYHFDDGYENLDVDVTSIVNSWLVSGSANNGFLIKLTGSVESNDDYNDYYIKRFYSRTSNFNDRRPYLEARWNDAVMDDRINLVYSRTGSLFMYNLVNGQLTDLSIGTNSLRVSIADASGTLLTLTGSHVGKTGIYSASFALPTGSYSGSLFYDKWGSGSYAFLTGTFSINNETPIRTMSPVRYTAVIRNLNNDYDPADNVRLDVFFRKKTNTQTVVLTASLGSKPEIVYKGYYAVENESTRERVIEFGTGSLETTRLSYDENGNYFNLRMGNLHAGNVYRILFLVHDRGQQQLVDEGFKFKIS